MKWLVTSPITSMMDSGIPSERIDATRVATLAEAVLKLGPYEAVELLTPEDDPTVARALARQNPAVADEILWAFPEERRGRILTATPAEQREQWARNHQYPEHSIGRLMDPPIAVLQEHQTAAEIIERLRRIVKKALVTYGWVVDANGKLVGVIVFRELLFASPEQPVKELMVKNPFALSPELSVTDAMREALKRHFPVYPVCDASGRLVGIVRGQSLFEHQAFELSAQAGTMVGVEKEERLGTPWQRSLRFRHPWLQLNLLTAFVAAAVVGVFQETLDQLVVLAVFLPVLAGQSGNTGCQALAVALRGITLGELQSDRAKAVVMKEALLGLLNGTLVGCTAGLGMFVFAHLQHNPAAPMLGVIVLMAMMCSCTVSGIAGATIPLILRRAGADPATASSIFLTTATDVVSMGVFLSLATWIVL
ncbi:MAG TPA: magnesium transporter [Polyangiaceae bacterium]|nr:magnesium transporter [Polyangiaceae bacterium]